MPLGFRWEHRAFSPVNHNAKIRAFSPGGDRCTIVPAATWPPLAAEVLIWLLISRSIPELSLRSRSFAFGFPVGTPGLAAISHNK